MAFRKKKYPDNKTGNSFHLTIKEYSWMQLLSPLFQLNHPSSVLFKASCCIAHCAADLLTIDALWVLGLGA